ncbi:MAG TPA: hypothetical protein VKQ52_10990, partial [Puia sp.]|nr:hypothetical protein [Puia sp.]
RRLAGQDTTLYPGGVQEEETHQGRASTSMETLGRYSGELGPGRLEAVVGLSYQQQRTSYHRLLASDYPSDALLSAGTGATALPDQQNSFSYRYLTFFQRSNYNLSRKYSLSAAIRREDIGGPGMAMPAGYFWNAGAAWVFSREAFLADSRLLSFGKIKVTYGTTGNDPGAGWQDPIGMPPPNARLPWQRNVNEELGLDLGFLHDRLQLSGMFLRGWSGNQLLTVTPDNGPVMPLMAVDHSGLVVVDHPGIKVENRVFEMELSGRRMRLGPLQWSSTLNLTIPRNRLAQWPGLAGSAYSGEYVAGKSLSVSSAYHYLGVDSRTGLYSFQTKNPDGLPGPGDRVPDAGFDPNYYAGWNNDFRIGNWQLEFFVLFRSQRGVNPLIALARQNAPGMQAAGQLSNGPVEWLTHWRKPGDVASQQRLTSGQDAAALARLNDYLASDGAVTDASYVRVKRIVLGWNMPEKKAKKMKMQTCRVFLDGANLWTITHFPVTDPETQDPRVLPPMRELSVGVKVGF